MADAQALAQLDESLRGHREGRLHGAPTDQAGRTGGQRDADRILYSTAFRRLGGVTQVVAVNETQLFHNRLTHSLKVAQIGQRLAQLLRANAPLEHLEAAGNVDPDVVYAAALAHDLGHPPFGHIAEDELQKELQRLSRGGRPSLADHDSFEGNAQSFRIATKTSWREETPLHGLNLTRATLAAIMKYPWLKEDAPEGKQNKWGAYNSEAAEAQYALAAPDGAPRPSGWRPPEAVLMDWSDDIAYAVHDVEDFYRAGLIPLERLATTGSASEASHFIGGVIARRAGKNGLAADGLTTAFEHLQRWVFPRGPYDPSPAGQAGVARLASSLITRFTSAVRLTPSGTVAIKPTVLHEVAILKDLTWHYMIENPALSTLQAGQRRQIRYLFRTLLSWADSAAGIETDDDLAPVNAKHLPTQMAHGLAVVRTDTQATDAYNLEPDGDALLRQRAVIDYITGLTEAQVHDLYERLAGVPGGSATAGWLRA